MWRKAGKISEKLSWMCSVYFCGLIPKHDWWFYFEVSGQLLLSLTKPLFITSLTSKVCGSELKPGSAALGAWGEALCFFPFVVDLNHPFETHSQCFPNLALGSFVGNSADTERQSVWWRNHSLRIPDLLSVSSTHAVLHVFTQLQLGLTPVPPLAGRETVVSFLSPLLGHPFPQALGLISNDISSSFGCWMWLSLQPSGGGVRRTKWIS